MNDTILLIYKPSIKRNYRILERAHETCQKWAYRYGAFFTLKKYNLIHLLNKSNKFNMRALI